MGKKISFVAFVFLCVSLISLVVFQVFAVTQSVFHGEVELTYKSKIGDLVTYGEFPQTYVGDTLNETLKAQLNDGTLSETGKIFNTFIYDTEVECKEYLYENERYVLIENAHFYNNFVSSFSTGDPFNASTDNGKSYFFKVEPIEFRVVQIDVENAKATLQSEKILFTMQYSSENNTYQTCQIRNFLNGSFATQSGLNSVAVSKTNQNTAPGNQTDGTGTPTDDIVWIASITNVEEWFNVKVVYGHTSNYLNLRKKVGDFAFPGYALLDTSKYPEFRGGRYITRTAGRVGTDPSKGKTTLCYFEGASGSFYVNRDIKDYDAGIVPCIVVNL